MNHIEIIRAACHARDYTNIDDLTHLAWTTTHDAHHYLRRNATEELRGVMTDHLIHLGWSKAGARMDGLVMWSAGEDLWSTFTQEDEDKLMVELLTRRSLSLGWEVCLVTSHVTPAHLADDEERVQMLTEVLHDGMDKILSSAQAVKVEGLQGLEPFRAAVLDQAGHVEALALWIWQEDVRAGLPINVTMRRLAMQGMSHAPYSEREAWAHIHARAAIDSKLQDAP